MSDAMTLTGRRPGDRCILAVDDDRTVRRLLSQVLSKRWSVLSADSGPDALRLLESNNVDLLLTDVVMPDMDGLTLVDRARQKFPQLPVAFVSGCWDDTTTSAASCRSPHMISKPLDLGALLERVSGILDRMPARQRAASTAAPARTESTSQAAPARAAGGESMSLLLQIAHLKKTAAMGLKVMVSDDGLAPDLRKGDVLTVTTASEAHLRSGDVLYCYHRDRTFARRFVRLTDTQDGVMVTIRDAVGYEDTYPWVQVIGRATRGERRGEELAVKGVRGGEKASWIARLLDRFR